MVEVLGKPLLQVDPVPHPILQQHFQWLFLRRFSSSNFFALIAAR